METIPDESGAVDVVKKGEVAYIMDVSAVDFMYRRDCQHLHMAKNVFSVNGLGLALPQGAEYKGTINSV